MATQDGKGKIHGKLNNTVYRVSGDKQIVQIMPAGVKQTQATKLNALEFGLASTQAKAIRYMLRQIYEECDGQMYRRFTTVIAACIRTSQKEIGDRDLHDADLDPLIGFQFNSHALFEKLITVKPVLDRTADGQFKFSLPLLNPMKDIKYPPGDTRTNPSFVIAAMAFHLRDEYMQVVDHATFDFDNLDHNVEISWTSSRRMPKGSFMIITFSLRYTSSNWLNQRIPTTDKHFYPTIVLDAFHVTEEIAAAQRNNSTFDEPLDEKIPLFSNTAHILKDIAQFRERAAKAKRVRK